jgi:hypothetical protein
LEALNLYRNRLERVRAGEEGRASQRYATRDIAVEFPIGASVLDISDAGMGIESNQQLRVGADYVFRVQIGSKSLGLPGKVEWCRFAGTAGTQGAERMAVYKAGISFAAGSARESWGVALQSLVDAGIQPVPLTPAFGV